MNRRGFLRSVVGGIVVSAPAVIGLSSFASSRPLRIIGSGWYEIPANPVQLFAAWNTLDYDMETGETFGVPRVPIGFTIPKSTDDLLAALRSAVRHGGDVFLPPGPLNIDRTLHI